MSYLFVSYAYLKIFWLSFFFLIHSQLFFVSYKYFTHYYLQYICFTFLITPLTFPLGSFLFYLDFS